MNPRGCFHRQSLKIAIQKTANPLFSMDSPFQGVFYDRIILILYHSTVP